MFDYDLNKQKYQEINKWIEDTENEKILLVIGQSGCGKMTVIKQVLKDLDHKYIIHDCLNRKNIENVIHSMTNCVLFKYFDQKQTFIILDEIYSIQNANVHLANIKKKYKGKINRIICTASDINLPKLSVFKKSCDIVHFDHVDKNSLENFICSMCELYNVKITNELKKYFIDEYGKDIKSIKNVLSLYKNYKKKLNIKTVSNSTFVNIKKDDLYLMTKDVFTKKDNFKNLEVKYSLDSTLFLYLCQENYTHYSNDIDTCLSVAEEFSEGDIYQKYIYDYNNWYLYDYLSYKNFISPNYYCNLNKSSRKLSKINSSYYLASKPTVNRVKNIYLKINSIMNYNFTVIDIQYLKVLMINKLIKNEEYDILHVLYNRVHVLSDYELLKIICPMQKNLIDNASKKKIKTYWKKYLSRT